MKAQKIISWTAASVGIVAVALGVSAAIPQKAQPVSVSVSEIEKDQDSSPICANTNASDVFSQDESQVLAAHYSGAPVANCMFVGCGGVI